MNAMPEDLYDVIIAGGGMVGASLALALAPTGWRIALIDPAGLGGDASPSFDDRATALSWSSRQFLTAIHVWDRIIDEAAAIEHIHVSEQGRFGRTRLHASDMGLDALGHVVCNRVIGRSLAARIAQQPNITSYPARVEAGPIQNDEQVTVQAQGRAIAGRLLVVADGAQSALRDALGIAAKTLYFPHQALVANVAVERGHRGWAYERFTTTGPMAMLPLPDSPQGDPRMNMVMSVPADDCEHWQAMSDSTFLATAQRRLGAHLGAFRQLGKLSVHPLVQVRSRTLLSHRVVLAGNAAMSLHPVAGQGFNLALRGVGDLCDRLYAVAGEHGDPGMGEHLAAHARHRARDMAWTGGWTRGLVEGFTADWPGVGRARSAALLALDRVPLARRWFTRQALGMLPDLSLLSRGVGGKR